MCPKGRKLRCPVAAIEKCSYLGMKMSASGRANLEAMGQVWAQRRQLNYFVFVLSQIRIMYTLCKRLSGARVHSCLGAIA
jgi:hypothetical protein